MARTTAPKRDLYAEVTEKIIASLEAGTVPWRKTWTSKSAAPQNAVSGRPYRGINLILLGITDFQSPFWLTFKQAQDLGGSVRKGEKSTTIIFWKRIQVEETDPNTGKKEKKVIPYARALSVFNIEQTDGCVFPKRVQEWQAGVEKVDGLNLDTAEEIIKGYADGPQIREDGTNAHYSPSTDILVVPPRQSFGDLEEFYATLFHEIGHSTGHKSRLDRWSNGHKHSFGCADYGREELIAEITASFLCAEAGITSQHENNAAYLASWIRTIKEDNKAVIVAAGAAQRAADHVLGRSWESEQEQAA